MKDCTDCFYFRPVMDACSSKCFTCENKSNFYGEECNETATINNNLKDRSISLTKEIKNCLILRLLTLDKCKNCDLYVKGELCKVQNESDNWLKEQDVK